MTIRGHRYAARVRWSGAAAGATTSYEGARAGIAVVAYDDDATGEMTLVDGKIRFREVVLRPRVVIVQVPA